MHPSCFPYTVHHCTHLLQHYLASMPHQIYVTFMLLTVSCCAHAGETIEAGDSIRDIFMQAVYEQISENLQSGGVAQGSNFWNLYSVGVGSDDPYQVTLADTSTMAVIAAHVRTPLHPPAIQHAGTCKLMRRMLQCDFQTMHTAEHLRPKCILE